MKKEEEIAATDKSKSKKKKAGGGAVRAKPYKLVVMGTGAVGKSACVLRLITDLFHDNYDPTIEDYYRKEIPIGDEELVSCDILDTAGQEEFLSMREQWVRDGEGFLFVYDISSKQSLDCVAEIRKSMDEIRGADMEYLPVMIVGNKCDLPDSADESSNGKFFRRVPKEEGKKVADELGCHWMEVSAKDDINITEAFTLLAREIREKTPEEPKKKGFCTIL